MFLMIIGAHFFSIHSLFSSEMDSDHQIGPIPIQENWRSCKKDDDCLWITDLCDNNYFINKKFKEDFFSKKKHFKRWTCVDLLKIKPNKTICLQNICDGQFINNK